MNPREHIRPDRATEVHTQPTVIDMHTGPCLVDNSNGKCLSSQTQNTAPIEAQQILLAQKLPGLVLPDGWRHNSTELCNGCVDITVTCRAYKKRYTVGAIMTHPVGQNDPGRLFVPVKSACASIAAVFCV